MVYTSSRGLRDVVGETCENWEAYAPRVERTVVMSAEDQTNRVGDGLDLHNIIKYKIKVSLIFYAPRKSEVKIRCNFGAGSTTDVATIIL